MCGHICGCRMESDSIDPVIQHPAGVNVKAGFQLLFPAVRQCQYQIRLMDKTVYDLFAAAAETVIKNQKFCAVNMHDRFFPAFLIFLRYRYLRKVLPFSAV